MAILKVTKGGTIYPIKLYGSEAETGIAGFPTFKVNYNGVPYYARMTTCLSGACGGDTPLRYKNSSGTTYQVTQKAEWTITVDGSSGQNICVSANGQTYKGANTLWFAEGTVWNAWVETDVNHHPGTLNISRGTLNGAVHLTVTALAIIPSGSVQYCSNEGGYPMTFTVPNYITVLSVQETTRDTNKTVHNYRVTPGKSYQITLTTQRVKSGNNYKTRKELYFNGTFITSYTGTHQAEFKISWSGTINTYGTEADFR